MLRTLAQRAALRPHHHHLRTLPALARTSLAATHRAFTMTAPRPNTTSLPPPFRLDPPSAEEEAADFAAQVESVESWFASPRFANIKRPYSASVVATKRGTQGLTTQHPSANISAQKLWAAFSRAAEADRPLLTMGAIDPIQMTQMAEHLEVLYVSGWATSSVLTTGNNETGPDLADYPYTSVRPNAHCDRPFCLLLTLCDAT